MKIGIITCHNVYNFGASLQAFALQNFLKRYYVNVEIIDYQPKYLYKLIDLKQVDSNKWNKNFITRNIYRIRVLPYKLSYIPKYLNYKNFNNKYFSLSSTTFCTVDSLNSMSGYDICICGSDQIWNSDKYHCGEDTAFFLSFTDCKKIAYAASFGSKKISSIGESNIIKYLPKFDRISVREKSGVDILKKYDINAELVVDPVFLLGTEEWRRLVNLRFKKKLPRNYILAYGYDNSSEFSEALNYYSYKTGYIVIDNKSDYLKKAGPLEFLILIENADMVITSSFHAVAFSLIFNTPFVATMTGNANLFERIKNLLQVSGLESRNYLNLKNIKNWENEKIDFNIANEKMKKFIEDSKHFLLNGVKN